MQIRSTITTSFLAIGLISFSISMSTLRIFSRIDVSSKLTKDFVIRSFDETHAILYHLEDIGIYLLSEGSPNAINIMPDLTPEQLIHEIEGHFDKLSKLIEPTKNTDTAAQESNLITISNSAQSIWKSFSSNYKHFLATFPNESSDMKIQTINTRLLPELKAIITTLHEYQRYSMSLSAHNQQAVHQSITSSSRWITMLGMVQLGLAILGCWVACHLVLKPLQSLVTTMERIQTGRTTVRFTYAGNNEMGYLARTFNEMVKHWHDSLTTQERTERQLLKRQKLLEDLFNFAPDAMMMIDPKGAISNVNHHGEIIFGWPKDELIGKPFNVLLSTSHGTTNPADNEDHLEKVFMDYLGVSGFKMKAITREGKRFDAKMNFKTMETESGPMITVVIRDVSPTV